MARALCVPRDPVEATAFEASRMRSRFTRRVNVGQFHERYFLFSVGMGLDARVVQLVEDNPEGKRKHGEWLFAGNALKAALTEYRGAEPSITVRVPGNEPMEGRPRGLLLRAPVHILQAVPRRRLSASPVGFGAGPSHIHKDPGREHPPHRVGDPGQQKSQLETFPLSQRPPGIRAGGAGTVTRPGRRRLHRRARTRRGAARPRRPPAIGLTPLKS
jgi:hypothetical protein